MIDTMEKNPIAGFLERMKLLFQGPLINLLVPFLAGLYMVLGAYPARNELSATLSHYPDLDTTSYEALRTGTKVLVTGTLVDNQEDERSGLVMYDRFHWIPYTNPSEDEDEELSATWGDSGRYVLGTVYIEIEGGKVGIERSFDARYAGDYTDEIIPPEEWVEIVLVDDIAVRSMRVEGFGNGDLVTVLGVKSESGEITPQEIYGGTRSDMVTYYRRPALLILGIGLAVTAIPVIAVVVLYIRLGHRIATGRTTVIR